MSLRFATLAIPLTLLTLNSCGSSTGPATELKGLWHTTSSPGSSIELSISNVVGAIRGTGAQYIEGSLLDSLTITGRWTDDRSFHLELVFRTATPATYDGSMVATNQLDGTFTRNGVTATHFAFYRQSQ